MLLEDLGIAACLIASTEPLVPDDWSPDWAIAFNADSKERLDSRHQFLQFKFSR